VKSLYFFLIISVFSFGITFSNEPESGHSVFGAKAKSVMNPQDSVALENDYVKVMFNSAACHNALTPGFGTRVIVALGKLTIQSSKGIIRLERGNVAAFLSGESYSTPDGAYFEVAFKTNHPPLKSPDKWIEPLKNKIVYEDDQIRVFEERLAPGDTRELHSHAQRLVVRLNNVQLTDPRTKPNGTPGGGIQVPNTVKFAEPMVHVVKNLSKDTPLFNVVIEFKLPVQAQLLPGFREYTYKQIDTIALKLYVKNPTDFNNKISYPLIVFFFGGGWNTGKVSQFETHANYFSTRGIITALADYRVKSRHQTTPFDAVADAKSVIRYLRGNAALLHIDTAKIVASGGSAGGHLAAGTATIPGLNDANDNLKVSCLPNALVLFNPVFDNGPSGYGYDRIGERYPEISPFHNIRKGTPPTIVFLGTKDDLVPVETARRYKQKMEEAGCRCDLFLYEGQKHGFFNYHDATKEGSRYFSETVNQTDLFLESLGYLKGKPTISEFIQQSQ